MTTQFLFQGIINDLKWDEFKDIEQEKLFAALGERLQNVIISTLLTSATPDQKQRLIEALESKDANVEEVVSEISGEIPNFEKILEQALLIEYEHIQALSPK